MENSAIVLPKSSRLNNLEYILARSTSNRMVLPRHQHLKMLNGKTVSQKTNSKVSSNHHHQNDSPFCDPKTNWKWKHVKKFKHSENTVTIRLFLGRITIVNIHFTYLHTCLKGGEGGMPPPWDFGLLLWTPPLGNCSTPLDPYFI